jgi:hypothetical protein
MLSYAIEPALHHGSAAWPLIFVPAHPRDIRQLLPVAIAHEEACFLLVDGPRWREAALGHDLPYAASSISSQPVKASRNFLLQVGDLIGDLIGDHRIGIGLQKRLERVVDQFKVDLTQLCFSTAILPLAPHAL